MTYTAGRHWNVLAFGITREEFAAEQAGKLPAFPPPQAPPVERKGGTDEAVPLPTLNQHES